MRLLLDTHVALWSIAASRRLSQRGRDLIADPSNSLFISSITIAEISIKFALGKGSAPPFSGADALRYFGQVGYTLLDLTAQHAAALDILPPLHRDPFDRMLIAQAMSEPLRLVTHDAQVVVYDNSIIMI